MASNICRITPARHEQLVSRALDYCTDLDISCSNDQRVINTCVETEYKVLLRDELDKAGIDQGPEASIYQWMEGDIKCFSNESGGTK